MKWCETNNRLIGFQIGGDWKYREKYWHGGFRFKGGGYVNFGDLQRNITTNDNRNQLYINGPILVNFNGRQHDEVFGVVMEAGMFTAYHFTPQFSLEFSYDMLWTNGLILAPQQLTLEPSRGRISFAGNVFYQSLSLSGKWVW